MPVLMATSAATAATQSAGSAPGPAASASSRARASLARSSAERALADPAPRPAVGCATPPMGEDVASPWPTIQRHAPQRNQW